MIRPIALPASDFAVIAIDLLMLANREAMGIEALQELAGSFPDDPAWRVVADIYRSAETLGDLHRLFRSLIPHEAELRAFITALSAATETEKAA